MSCKVKGYFPDDEERTITEEPTVLLTKNCILRLFYLLSREYKITLKETYSYDNDKLVSMIQEHEKLYYDIVNVLKEGPEPCLDSLVKASKAIYKDLSNYNWKKAKKFSAKFNDWCSYVRTQDDWKDIIQTIVDKQMSPIGSITLSNAMYTALCRNYYCSYEDVITLIQLTKDEPSNPSFNSFYDYMECYKDIFWNDVIISIIHGMLSCPHANSYHHEAVLLLFPKLINLYNTRRARIGEGHDFPLPSLLGAPIAGRIADIFATTITADIDLYLKCVNSHVFDGMANTESMRSAILFSLNNSQAFKTKARYNLAKVRNLVEQFVDRQCATNIESRFKHIDYTLKEVDDIVRKIYSFSCVIRGFWFYKPKGMDVSPSLVTRKKLFQKII